MAADEHTSILWSIIAHLKSAVLITTQQKYSGLHYVPTEICVEHFEGTCPGKDHCQKEHVYATYQWYTAPSQDTRDWSACERLLNDQLEELYCDVTNPKPSLEGDGTSPISIDFHNMVLSSGVHLKRIATPSYGSRSATSFHTTWHWYWLSNSDKWLWLDYETKDEFQESSLTMRELEMAYQQKQNGSVKFSNGRFQYKLDFCKMQQQNKKTGTVRPVLRRPMYKPPPQQYICTAYLSKKCSDEDCPSYHIDELYEWQILSDAVQAVWIPVKKINSKLEEMYCDPNCNSVLPKYGDVSNVEVDFKESCLSTGPKLRRISTPSSAVPNAKEHHTTWQWYWESSQGKWMCYGQEDEFGNAGIENIEIECAYIQGKSENLKFKNTRYNYTLCFATMKEYNEETGTERDVIRRPKTYKIDAMTKDRSICIEYLQKKCKKGQDCPDIHSDLPYQWMIHNPNWEEKWLAPSPRENQQLERYYGDVYQKVFPIRLNNRLVKVDFDEMRTLDGDYIKRFSTLSSVEKSESSAKTKNKSSKTDNTSPRSSKSNVPSKDSILQNCTESETNSADGTKWEWFYMDENNRWIGFDTVCSLCQHNPIDITSDDIEKVYLDLTAKKQLTYTQHGEQYILDLNKMIQTNQETSQLTAVMRRPVSFVASVHAKSESICISFLEGMCTLGSSCPSMHCLQPYQWCYKTQGTSTWSIFVKSVNEQLEHNYCDPSVEKTSISMPCGSYGTVCFKTMTLEYKNKIMHLTRGSTDSSVSTSADKVTITEHHTVWVWYIQNDDKQWTPFGKEAFVAKWCIQSKEIELAYTTNPEGKVSYGNKQYAIDFERFQWKEISHDDLTNHGQTVRRRPKLNAAISCPISWGIDTNYEGYKLVELDPQNHDKEYNKIAFLFSKSCSKDIKKIERVQNPKLWEAYSRRKKQMLVIAGKTKVEERQLFHGTESQYLDPILEQGFDFRLAGTTTGARYGKGSYFARDASYSNRYATKSSQMLVCCVLVGEYTEGCGGLRRPPPLSSDRKFGPFYDSTVDSQDHPRIFVVYHFDQAYPEYLITYN